MSTPVDRGSRGGFTLIEILVVVIIMLLLAGLLLPVVWRVEESGRAVACLANLRQVGAGLSGYLADHELTMPTLLAGRSAISEDVPVIDTVLLPYAKSHEVFHCPSDSHLAKETGTSYYWNVALNDQRLGSLTFLKLTEEQSKIPVLSDKEGFHPYLENKVNILYADGHATKDLKFLTK